MSEDWDDTVAEVLEEHATAVRDYRDGSHATMNYLMGQVMAATEGELGPNQAHDAIDRVIDANEPEWPVTFTAGPRDVDISSIHQRIDAIIPAWASRPVPEDGRVNDFELAFNVTVHRDGEVEIEVADDE